MNGFEDRPRSWNEDSITPSELAYGRDGTWKDLGTSMSAISFGLAATAILISMFLVMAFFEHVIKPRTSFLRPRSSTEGSPEQGHPQIHSQEKYQTSVPVRAQCTSDLSVLMPGQQYPTFIAQPAPLLPCPREGIYWPSHDQSHLPYL
ncbi:hypothetical protein Cni_G24862 [Canna indica]|uniref:Uncharacterized protein n=1 Tax=Canna indica TaxID=4628 RepID=A0AAQ3QPZ1_9LILI|nr:hypothetical protein Cni_G24862 [Canna indica]